MTKTLLTSLNRKMQELLPQYKYDNISISNKFKKTFPEFKFTTYWEGITNILNEQKQWL